MGNAIERLARYEGRLRQWKEAQEEGLRYLEPDPAQFGLLRRQEVWLGKVIRDRVMKEPRRETI